MQLHKYIYIYVCVCVQNTLKKKSNIKTTMTYHKGACEGSCVCTTCHVILPEQCAGYYFKTCF